MQRPWRRHELYVCETAFTYNAVIISVDEFSQQSRGPGLLLPISIPRTGPDIQYVVFYFF